MIKRCSIGTGFTETQQFFSQGLGQSFPSHLQCTTSIIVTRYFGEAKKNVLRYCIHAQARGISLIGGLPGDRLDESKLGYYI